MTDQACLCFCRKETRCRLIGSAGLRGVGARLVPFCPSIFDLTYQLWIIPPKPAPARPKRQLSKGKVRLKWTNQEHWVGILLINMLVRIHPMYPSSAQNISQIPTLCSTPLLVPNNYRLARNNLPS